MVFNSLTFVVFFTIVLALHALPLGWTIRKSNLLIASYLFYAAWLCVYRRVVAARSNDDCFGRTWPFRSA